MKLLLVNPKSGRSGFTLNSSSLFPPLGLGIVQALTPPNWEVELIDENFAPFKYRDADLVAFTAFTATAPRAYEIAAEYKKRKISTVIGGAHASVCPEEALEYCDAVVIGEAESAWDMVISAFSRDQLNGVYAGKPDKIATPNRSLFNKGYERKTVQTTRGCPLDCDYCSVSMVNGKRYRSRSTEDVLADLTDLTQHFFIVDDNFVGYGSNRRKKVVEILEYLINMGNSKLWFCQTSINVAQDDELLELLFAAGCRMLFIGVETEDGTSLINNNSKRSISCAESMESIHKHGMSVLGAFIVGLEDDTHDHVRNRWSQYTNMG